MEELKLNNQFVELQSTELESVDGGVAPLLIFLGKAALSGAGFALGYWGLDQIL